MPATVTGFDIAYATPFDWAWICGFLAHRRIEGVESVDAGVYRRVLSMPHHGARLHGWIEVRDRPAEGVLRVAVSDGLAPAGVALREALERLFDTGCPSARVVAALGELAHGRPGLRVPGCVDGYELATRAVLGQQVSVRAAHTLAARLVARFGRPVGTPHAALCRAFPEAAVIASAPVDEVRALGVVGQRARALLALSEAVASGRIVLSPAVDPATTVSALESLPGIGPWTAQYVAMRALRVADAFPASDLVVMRALGVRGPRAATEAAQRWRPWRAYAVMHLWDSAARVESGNR